MGKEAFDDLAASYDEVFTRTEVGRLQREKVWKYLDNNFDFNKPINVLELNCGTGEDAIRFAQRGCKVMATDISQNMVDITREKVEKAGLSGQVECQVLDIKRITSEDLDHEYDLVFSNFGGLNCVSIRRIRKLQTALWEGLRSKGRLVAVAMPTFCAFESLYFLSKLNPKKAFRRTKRSSNWVNGSGETIRIHYHSPGRFIDQFGKRFRAKALIPVGFWLPPSYLDPFFRKHPKWLEQLDNQEQRTEHSLLAGLSDHYLVDLELKN